MVLDRSQILELIPHRPPFLWIDRVTELEAGVRCVAVKYVDPEEPVFAGHFPGDAILPGVLIIEAAAQTAAVMFGSANKPVAPTGAGDAMPLLAAIRGFKFLKPVRPGSELRIETRKVAELGPMASVETRIWVGDQEVARGELFVRSPEGAGGNDAGDR